MCGVSDDWRQASELPVGSVPLPLDGVDVIGLTESPTPGTRLISQAHAIAPTQAAVSSSRALSLRLCMGDIMTFIKTFKIKFELIPI